MSKQYVNENYLSYFKKFIKIYIMANPNKDHDQENIS